MEKTGSQGINPWFVFKEALQSWLRNAVAAAALYCVIIFLGRLLKMSLPVCSFYPEWMPSGIWEWLAVFLTGFFILAVLAVLLIDSLLILMIVHFTDPRNKGRVSFATVFEESRRQVLLALKAFLLLFLFIRVLVSTGQTFIFWGRSLANSSTEKIGILLATHTAGVVFFIAAAWYGFLFSLGPWVAAIEKKSAREALIESRRRVRGRALRYLCSLAIVAALYVAALWISVFCIVGHLAHPRKILVAVDLLLQVVFVTLFFTVWFTNYLKLSEPRQVDSSLKRL